MRRLRHVALVIGLTLLVVVIVRQGAGDIAALLGTVGVGVLLLVPLFVLPLTLATLAWSRLLGAEHEVRRGVLLRASWVALAVNWLLPVAQIGGEVVRAAMLARAGVPAGESAASVLVDKTLQFMGQVVLAALALALLLWRGGASGGLLISSAIVVGVLGAMLAGFWVVQRRGVRAMPAAFLRRMAPRAARGEDDPAWARAFDGTLREIRTRRGRLLVAAILNVAFRLSLTIEVWVVMHLIGQPISIVDALILEGLTQGARAAAFLIPAGIGAQEGAFAIVASALSINPEIGVTVSLAKRVRELLVGVPALMMLQGGALKRMLA